MTATAPHYATEADSAAAFDAAVEATGLFFNYKEIRGTLLQPRPGQIDKSVRIDRLMLPTQRLMDLGWHHGAVGVEIKRSGVKVGPAVAQAMDYSRACFTIFGGVQVVPSMVFLWPVDKQHGPLASVLAQNRLGTAEANRWAALRLMSGEMTVLHATHTGEVRLGAVASGAKVGSR